MIPMSESVLTSDPRNEGYDRDIRHYVFDIGKTGWNYSVGDCLAIHPNNPESELLPFLDSLKVKPDEVIEIQNIVGGRNPYGQNLTAKQLFGSALDIFGKPNRRFYEFAGIAATDPKEKAELKHLISKEGVEDLKSLVNETVTYADLLHMYPSVG